MRAIELTAKNSPAFHPRNLLHNLRAVFGAAVPIFYDQSDILALCQLHAAKVQDLGAPKAHFGQRYKIQFAQDFEFATTCGSAEQTPSTSLIISQHSAF